MDNDLIEVVERDDHLGFYSFLVGDLKTVVSVEVARLLETDEATYRLSHHIKTPVQVGPYIQSRPYWDYVAYALHQAITSVTSYYRNAVKAGHQLQENWLVAS